MVHHRRGMNASTPMKRWRPTGSEEVRRGTTRQPSGVQGEKVAPRPVWSEGTPVCICATGTLWEIFWVPCCLFCVRHPSMCLPSLLVIKGYCKEMNTFSDKIPRGSGSTIMDRNKTVSFKCRWVRVLLAGSPGRLRSASICGTLRTDVVYSFPLFPPTGSTGGSCVWL